MVICPMEIERSAAARWSRGRAAVVCCGPGPREIGAFLRGLSGADTAIDRLFILFGVAGGLTHGVTCPPVARVIDGEGGEWRPSVGREHSASGSTAASSSSRASSPVTLIGVNEIVGDPAAKRALHERTGAAMVDTESHVFAAWAAGRVQRWAIIRAVSDGPSESLPAAMTRWVDQRGRVRASRLALDVITRPALIGIARRVGRRTNDALSAAGAALDRLLDTESTRSKNHA